MSSITEHIKGKDLDHFISVFEDILEALRSKTDYFKPLPVCDFSMALKFLQWKLKELRLFKTISLHKELKISRWLSAKKVPIRELSSLKNKTVVNCNWIFWMPKKFNRNQSRLIERRIMLYLDGISLSFFTKKTSRDYARENSSYFSKYGYFSSLQFGKQLLVLSCNPQLPICYVTEEKRNGSGRIRFFF